MSITSTIKRLYSDMAELLRDPLWRASAMPLEDNILEWHANICGPDGSAFAKTPLHITLKFNNYPTQPPVVRLGTTISHPNVYGDTLCLDMLEEGMWAFEFFISQPYVGWSSAYSVSSILRQLQVFLLDRKGTGANLGSAVENARNYQCPKCKHNGMAPWPALSSTTLLQNKVVAAPTTVLAANRDLQQFVQKLKEKKQPIALPADNAPNQPQITPAKSQTNHTNQHIGPIENTWATIVSGRKISEPGSASSASAQSTHDASSPAPAVETQNTNAGKQNKKKKPQHRKKPQRGPKKTIPTGFVIKEDPARADEVQQYNFIDQLVQQTIQKEKLKQEAAQKKKTKKKTKTINASVVQVTPVIEQSQSVSVTPVNELPQAMTPVKAEGSITKVKFPVETKLVTIVAYSGPSLSDMPYDVLLSVVNYIRWTDLNNLTCVNKQLSTLTQESHVWKTFCLKYCGNTPDVVKKMSNMTWSANETWKDLFMKSRNFVKNQLRCFHLKVSFEDDLLGIPLSFKHGEGSNRWIAEISSPLDVLSHQAFAIEKIRKACWKEPFQYWLPLFINKEHSKRALPWLIKYIPGMLNKTMFYTTDVVTILPKLMSTMVVEVMSEKKHASFKALEGYCWFHRWFLEFATTNRDVRQAVDMKITNFVKSEQFRTKKETPSLGEWICLLSVSDRYNWTNVSAAYINENFDRNVKWLVQKHPELEVRGLDAETRCELTFNASLVSLRLLMFHVFFLDFVKPKGLSLGQIKEHYDAFYGMISHSQKEQFQKEVFAIMAVSTWEDFFSYIKLKKMPELDQFVAILEGSVANSLRKCYHKLIKRPGTNPTTYIQ